MAKRTTITVADVRAMLRGQRTQAAPTTQAGRPETTQTPTPKLPKDAVSATVETVKEEPLKTTETVEVVTAPPVGAKRKGA